MHFYVIYNWRQCQYTRGAVTKGRRKKREHELVWLFHRDLAPPHEMISLFLMLFCGCRFCCYCWRSSCACYFCKHWIKRESENREKNEERESWIQQKSTNTHNKRQQKETRLIHKFFFLYGNGVVVLFSKTTLYSFKWFIFVWTSTPCQLHKSPAKLLPMRIAM